MPKFSHIRKVLILGSGAIKIGEAAEFDYSGSQCLKAMKEEEIETVLINPNIATIQTDLRLAGKVYLLPVKLKYVKEVIKKERPNGIFLGFGGQTALNCGVQLAKKGILEKYNVEVLGTPISAIETTEDRQLFKEAMIRFNIPVPKSQPATSVEEALKVAEKVGYPVIVRVAYILGGKGSGLANNKDELAAIVSRALAQSMISQVLIEEYLVHWKEVEYEVMRDRANNCLTACNMENFDPLGIHTGDSIVVAPSQTLSNREYHMLRSASVNVIQSLGIVGECNIQWALDPNSERYCAIEVNARMSRSSALASKATGYPLAYIAAKLGVGYMLPELTNKITGVTSAFFEPSLDYIVTKIPRWDLQKFRKVDRRIGPQMKSVGEVMAIDRCFEGSLQKAIRMLDIGKLGLTCNPEDDEFESFETIKDVLANPTDQRLFTITKAIKNCIPIDEIYQLSGVDPWFLYKIKNIVDMERRLRSSNLKTETPVETIKEAKRLGFSDSQIAVCLKKDEATVRKIRKEYGIIPVVKQIDTLAAEWPAQTNYLYLTYCGDEDDVKFTSNSSKIMVLGSGVFRIGSSVEFDWCCVNTIWALKKHGVDEAIIVNYNPETVSTDYDTCDKLYFEELTLERILDIYEKENPLGVVVSVGGQIPNNIALKLANSGVELLGTSARSIDKAEDRSKFSALLDKLGIPQPKWSTLTTVQDVEKFADKIGYPALVRPSYVLSGSAMRVAYAKEELKRYLKLAAKISAEHPVVVSKFIQDAKEVEVDGVSDGKNIVIGAIIEHVENAGIHSGDAAMCIPPQTLSNDVLKTIRKYTTRIGKALEIKGPFNIQYLVKNGTTYVIECNLRASRSVPFVSKTVGINLIELSTMAILGKCFHDSKISSPQPTRHVGVKAPMFSFMRLSGADTILGVEMLSTGEVACLGENFADAFLKALEAAEFKMPPLNGSVLITVSDEAKKKIIPVARALSSVGFKIYATEHTAETFYNAGLKSVTILHKIRNPQAKPNIMEYLLQQKIDLVINIPLTNTVNKIEYTDAMKDQYIIRRLAVEFNIPVVTTMELAFALTNALRQLQNKNLTIRSLNEYMADSK